MTSDPPRPEGADAPGLDALQGAALEVIDATRALLDVAEALVHDPEVVERIGEVVRSVSGAAGRALRTVDASAGRGGDDDSDGGFERITVD